jgi:hypothetical protein
MIEAHSLHVLVSSDHPLADEQVAQAIARVLSRYAIDFTPGVEVNVPHDGDDVTYVASAHMSFLSNLHASRTRSTIRTESAKTSPMAAYADATT